MLGVCYHLYFVFYVVLMIYDSNCNTSSCAYTAIWYVVIYICVRMGVPTKLPLGRQKSHKSTLKQTIFP